MEVEVGVAGAEDDPPPPPPPPRIGEEVTLRLALLPLLGKPGELGLEGEPLNPGEGILEINNAANAAVVRVGVVVAVVAVVVTVGVRREREEEEAEAVEEEGGGGGACEEEREKSVEKREGEEGRFGAGFAGLPDFLSGDNGSGCFDSPSTANVPGRNGDRDRLILLSPSFAAPITSCCCLFSLSTGERGGGGDAIREGRAGLVDKVEGEREGEEGERSKEGEERV